MLTLFWKNATHKRVGARNGVTPTDLAEIEPRLRKAHEAVVSQCHDGKLGYATLPTNETYRKQVTDLVARYKENTTDMVVLGIGGSALGNIALQSALNPSTYNILTERKRKGPRLFVLDNVDPCYVHDVLKFVSRRASSTLVNVISKSGETAETASQFMLFRQMLRDKIGDNFASRIVATTDASKGTLHDIAKKEGYAMLPVPGDVGGRFSVLSPVGLFSAAMCGIDIDKLLEGANAMRQRAEVMDVMQNPATILAAIKYIMFTKKKKPMHVMMSYSNRLYMLADWYRQLWAESLGKQYDREGNEVFTGPTPIKALGTTDQHSQVQLYREGPNDKFTVFLDVKKQPEDIRVPNTFDDIQGMSYLRKKRMSKLLQAEKLATEYAMTVSQRPSVTLTFPEISERYIGEFLFLYEFTTSIMGELMNINAYDQPAVELGKKATFALMGRKGYEELAEKMKSFVRMDRRYQA
ncbi:MAG TPA: glucose-6-phosphate isomerase [Phycisphaerae bacterium]|nr:glucose-6-phosphate isomerase [Phycisphaerae bacterium]HPS52053.1 glucose-6-phosphate isomerase [Phycisphaerae bacterium]